MEHISKSDVHAVFFDAVGTLIHPEPPAAEVYAAVGRRFGSSLSAHIIQKRFKHAYRREEGADRANGLRTNDDHERGRWRRIVAEVLFDVDDGCCFEELFTHFSRPESWRCDSQVGPVLSELAGRGFLLGIASNFDNRLRTVVAGRPELTRIRHLVISSEVGWRKPAPAFFEAIARLVELPPAQILYVGDDRKNDVEGARAAGMQSLLLDPRTEELHRVMERALPGFATGV
jgi:putative hydrolase of the HAD superfamily